MNNSLDKSSYLLFQNYKSSIESTGANGDFLDMSVQLLENSSILLKNFKSKAAYT